MVNFNTELFVKSKNISIKNEVELYPITKTVLTNLLENAGFSKIQHFRSFSGDELKVNSLPLVIIAQK